MAYTPELCLDDSAALRRIAWGLGMPMTKALSLIVRKAVRKNKHYKICEHCKDRSKCNTCPFKGE
jgi:hypothetical protein